MAVSNNYYDDAVIRRAIYIERLKTGQRVNYDRVLSLLIPRLHAVMARYDVENVSDLSTRQLASLINEMSRELDKASSAFAGRLLVWLKQFGREQNDWHTLLMENTIDEEEDALPVVPYRYTDELIFAGIVGSTGMTIKESLAALVATQKRHIAQRVKIAAAQNQKMSVAMRDIIGTRGAKYRDGLMGQFRNFGHELVGSMIQFAANRTNMGFLDKFQDYVAGYMWVSILDSKTSATCRSLDGQVFELGEGPVPPAHPNCRSHITAVFRTGVKFLKGLTRKATSGSIDAGVSYYTWLKRQSASFQDSVLGKTRGKLFRNGGVSAKEFGRLNVGRNYEQLTLEQLRGLYPEMFEEAGIP